MAAAACPYCESEISSTAKKCRHCGEWVVDRPDPAPSEENVMRSHRKAEGAAWGVALLGMIFGVPTCVGGAPGVGFGVVLVSLIIACVIYYG